MNTSFPQLVSTAVSLMVLAAGAASCGAPRRENVEATNATLAYLESNYGRVDRLEVDRLMRRVSAKLVHARAGLQAFPEHEAIEVERVQSLPWQVHVIGDNEINAFAIGSGVLVITKGMIRALSSEAMLAAVIAHEMAHEYLGHTTEALAANEQENALFQHYDLEQEIAADTLSALLLHAAGYDPDAAIQALVTVQQQMPSSEAPRFASRIAALDSKLATIERQRPYFVNTREFNRVRARL